MWSKDKLNKSDTSFSGIKIINFKILKSLKSFYFKDQIFPSTTAHLNNQQFCYSNYVVINIDGPVNYNASYSCSDDGSDINFTDINTLRFFYNLGIEV